MVAVFSFPSTRENNLCIYLLIKTSTPKTQDTWATNITHRGRLSWNQLRQSGWVVEILTIDLLPQPLPWSSHSDSLVYCFHQFMEWVLSFITSVSWLTYTSHNIYINTYIYTSYKNTSLPVKYQPMIMVWIFINYENDNIQEETE